MGDREYRGEQAESQTAVEQYQGGLITRNEARARVGLDPIEGGDVFVNSTSNELQDVNKTNHKESEEAP